MNPDGQQTLHRWRESRCDSVCLRSRHIGARLQAKLTLEMLSGAGFAGGPAALRFAGGGSGRSATTATTATGWRESRCDSVCLRSRHIGAWLHAQLTRETLSGAGFAGGPAALRFAGGGSGRSATTATTGGIRFDWNQ